MKPPHPPRYYCWGALGAPGSAVAAVLSPRPGGCPGWGCTEVPRLCSCEGQPGFGHVSAPVVRVFSTQPGSRGSGRAVDVAAGRGAQRWVWELQPGHERGRSASAQLAITVLSSRAWLFGELRASNPQRRAGVGSWRGSGLRKAAASARHAGFSPWVPSRCCSRINGVMTAFDEMPMHHTCSYFGNVLALLILPAVTGCLIRFLQLCFFFFLKLSKTSAQRSAPGREVLGVPRAPVLEGGTAPWQQRSWGGF